ncbi:hypothetical protein V2J09_012844 [Rumex salicifolius]
MTLKHYNVIFFSFNTMTKNDILDQLRDVTLVAKEEFMKNSIDLELKAVGYGDSLLFGSVCSTLVTETALDIEMIHQAAQIKSLGT